MTLYVCVYCRMVQIIGEKKPKYIFIFMVIIIKIMVLTHSTIISLIVLFLKCSIIYLLMLVHWIFKICLFILWSFIPSIFMAILTLTFTFILPSWIYTKFSYTITIYFCWFIKSVLIHFPFSHFFSGGDMVYFMFLICFIIVLIIFSVYFSNSMFMEESEVENDDAVGNCRRSRWWWW